MFNLLMQGIAWEGERDTFPFNRIFEYTDSQLTTRFRSADGAAPLLQSLLEFPCLFMEEGVDDQVARVGMITRARVAGREVAIEYRFDPFVPALHNGAIFANRQDFDMDSKFEFNRTHWAVKDVDLYRSLLRLVRPMRQLPTVFKLEEHERIDEELVSVMMPFEAKFDPVYKTIRLAAEAAGLRCKRGDDIWEEPAIIQDVVTLIDHSQAVVCDCTGRNPNVFYEMGIAHTLGRDVVLIAQSEVDIPFDVRHLRYINYLNNDEGRKALQSALTTRLEKVASSSVG